MTQEKETNRQAEQGKAETEIPCAVCRDLIPLGLGGVGSPIGWLLNYASGKGEKKHESEK